MEVVTQLAVSYLILFADTSGLVSLPDEARVVFRVLGEETEEDRKPALIELQYTLQYSRTPPARLSPPSPLPLLLFRHLLLPAISYEARIDVHMMHQHIRVATPLQWSEVHVN